MPELDSPTSRPDLSEPTNCLHIATAKPGQEIRVLVRPEDNATAAKLMEAVGSHELVKVGACWWYRNMQRTMWR